MRLSVTLGAMAESSEACSGRAFFQCMIFALLMLPTMFVGCGVAYTIMIAFAVGLFAAVLVMLKRGSGVRA